MATLLVILVAAPGLAFLLMALMWLLGLRPTERLLARVTATVSSVSVVASALIGMTLYTTGQRSIHVTLGEWFSAGEYTFELSLFVDRLSWPLVQLTTILIALVGVFSVRYLHRERGFFRFFALLHLFSFGAVVAFTSSSFDLLLGGWELVGITSVLLIAYFDERREPVSNSIRVFAAYRIADLGLILGIFALHSLAPSTEARQLFTGDWPYQTVSLTPGAATTIGLLFLLAAAGKSAQIPFCGWLPRAMEGPTPSSAIFYGAISVHMGAYLLLRTQPVLAASPFATTAVLIVGAATALFATLAHRVSTDAKTSLAYASMAQLGIIFVEIALGWPRLALAHMVGHAIVRTAQFLRAPSMLHDYHRVHAAAGGHLAQTGTHYEVILPAWVRSWLYRAGLERGYYDAILDRIVDPVLAFARWCERFEPAISTKRAARRQAVEVLEGRLAERAGN